MDAEPNRRGPERSHPPEAVEDPMALAPDPSNQDTAPQVSLATLRRVLARGQQAHPELAARMQRAAEIVAFRKIAPAVNGQPGCFWVESSDGSTEYWVRQDPRGNFRFDSCSCPDAQQRGSPCKHTIAVRLFAACERAESRSEPISFPIPTLDPDAPIPFELTCKAHAVLDDPAPLPA
jgi:hypothetical protein